MKARYQPEIRRAALAALRSGDTLISRQRIEDEIEDHPDRYPGLIGRSRIGRRRIITLAMNEMFPFWSKTGGVHPSSFVWKVRAEHEQPTTEPEEEQ
ncbi:hypothetical protein Mhun_1883 [Methanospirillum hungatei JF-1]|jgi:hypothetical protein|uniref:Uncharacterized protein n=1 Tax=Methanospirillum hungatei JF-1 (strain ATCC 27890 / DSM 864 / NBRC 100397 / JF-1) TaxID=323259 RepID=Q2FM32_METHJ|nr:MULTISPECIES: hypothetical protein [Methanospirillum]ABD41600.1 hypothetical protein Mhun_1883 [Methanospirillum hungatei JF-1]MBP9008206.1 hypothetical protein [Methanospirillum sp.]NLL11143.1 hypothetical protein [Methanomicrobiales archaeon]